MSVVGSSRPTRTDRRLLASPAGAPHLTCRCPSGRFRMAGTIGSRLAARPRYRTSSGGVDAGTWPDQPSPSEGRAAIIGDGRPAPAHLGRPRSRLPGDLLGLRARGRAAVRRVPARPRRPAGAARRDPDRPAGRPPGAAPPARVVRAVRRSRASGPARPEVRAASGGSPSRWAPRSPGAGRGSGSARRSSSRSPSTPTANAGAATTRRPSSPPWPPASSGCRWPAPWSAAGRRSPSSSSDATSGRPTSPARSACAAPTRSRRRAIARALGPPRRRRRHDRRDAGGLRRGPRGGRRRGPSRRSPSPASAEASGRPDVYSSRDRIRSREAAGVGPGGEA